MTKIQITMDPHDEYADPNHEMGITEEAYIELATLLAGYGDDVEIERVES